MKKGDAEQIYAMLKERVEKIPEPANPLYREVADRIKPGDKYLPRMLSRLADPEQIRIVAALPDPNAPGGKSLEISEQFAADLGMEKSKVQAHIQEMFEEGLLFPTKKGPNVARTFIQLHDAALGNPRFDSKLGKEYFDLWGIIDGEMREPRKEDAKSENAEFRVIPRWKSIENVPGVQIFEDIKEILKAQDTIAIVPCGCKRSHNDRWCGIPEETCICLGRTAQYNIGRNVGRKITFEEALEILDNFDKMPLVNLTINQRDVTQLICNCHYCCCLALKYAQKSRFLVVGDPEKCKGCGACIKKCQFGAISLKSYPGLEGKRAAVDEDACRGCGSCAVTCKAAAWEMKIIRPAEHIPESLKIY